MSRTHVFVVRNWDEMLTARGIADEIILGGRDDFRAEVIKKVEVTGYPYRPGETSQTVAAQGKWRVKPAMSYPVAIKKVGPA